MGHNIHWVLMFARKGKKNTKRINNQCWTRFQVEGVQKKNREKRTRDENGFGELLTISKVSYKPLQMHFSVKWQRSSSSSYAKPLVTPFQSFAVLRFQINNAFRRKWMDGGEGREGKKTQPSQGVILSAGMENDANY